MHNRTLLKLTFALFTAAALAACGAMQEYWIDDKEKQLAAKKYTVNKGDTLYSIAWLYELDYRQLAKWNDVKAPDYLIYPGQQLRLSAPQSMSADSNASEPKALANKAIKISKWHWPLDNPEVEALPRANAILMKGKQSETVRAVADGVVVYSGFNLKHYHGLIIIKHSKDVFSIYGNNKELLVVEKEQVAAGQKVARLSDKQGDANLYFEMRQGNRSLKAVNYLPNLKISKH